MLILEERVKDHEEIEVVEGFIVPHNKRPIVISQGYNGPWSHKNFLVTGSVNHSIVYETDRTFATDFAVSFGTTVIAPRDGKVCALYSSPNFYEGKDLMKGIATLASFIILDHGDFFSTLAHLDNIYVDHEYYVKQGERIATTGRTGWIGDIPNLHFEVFRNKGVGVQSYPVNFEDYDGPLMHSEIFG